MQDAKAESPRDQFIEAYKLSDDEINKYEKLTSIFEASAIHSLVMFLFSILAYTGIANYVEGDAGTFLGISAALAIILGYLYINSAISNKIASLGISDQDYYYHYLAQSIEKCNAGNEDFIEDLKRVCKGIENGERVLSPQREQELVQFTERIEAGIERGEDIDRYGQSYSEFFDRIAQEIQYLEEDPLHEIIEDTFINDRTYDQSYSTFKLVAEAVAEYSKNKHIMIGIPLLIFVSGTFIAIFYRIEVGAVILGALTLFQIISSNTKDQS